MNKWLSFLICILLLGTLGCTKETRDSDYVNKIAEMASELNEYYLEAKMEVVREDATISFDIQVSYLAPHYFRVVLKNKESNHIQAIVKNDEGVFVLTPSLNKQFKFTSDWPLNSSHSYLLQSLVKDIINDETRTIVSTDSTVEITTKVNHKTNSQLKTQKITFSKKELKPLYVNVYDQSNNAKITVTFQKFTKTPGLKKLDFIVENVNTMLLIEISEGTVSTDIHSVTATYIPVGSSLVNAITSEGRKMYSYAGEKAYTIVCQTVADTGVSSVTRFLSDAVLLDWGLGGVTDKSMHFYCYDVLVSIYSDSLSIDEFASIANSFQTSVAS